MLAAITIGAPAIRADEVDDLLKAELHKRHLPALSVAVVRDGQLIKAAACGLANVELEVPATPQTVFQIQSITKTFTSAAILMLMEEGKLSLADPVGKHLEGTPDAWKDITLRHLLSHTSGIKDFINEPTASLRLAVTEEEVLKATAPRPLNFTPGQRYSYSNTNFHLLAMVIRKLTGKWYGDFLKERIFDPLGMNQTRIVSHSDLIPHRASGYHRFGDTFVNGEFVDDSILGYGGGGIVSTAPDMARWAMAFESGKLLKRETIDLAWTPATLNDGGSAPYGLGWGIGSINGHRQVEHSGAHVTGFTSQLSLYPEDRLAVVVLTNSAAGYPGPIAREIAGLYVPALAPPPPQAPRPIEDKEPQVTALLRECLIRTPEWTLEPQAFTAEFWKVINEKRIMVQLLVKTLGELKALELLSRREFRDLRVYEYRMKFANRTMTLTMSLTADGKITGMDAVDE
jgi:CubicO group peptidase (beta-lactamase class C family)